MSINSVSSSSSVYSVQATTFDASSATASDVTTPLSGVSVDISKPGQLMGQLSSLAQSNPDQFKSVTASIAQQLQDAASSQSGAAADALTKLADRFSNASQSGSASALTPAGGGHHHHGGGGHHRVHAAANASDPSAATGGGGGSLAQLVQGIISNTLDDSPSDPTATSTSTT